MRNKALRQINTVLLSIIKNIHAGSYFHPAFQHNIHIINKDVFTMHKYSVIFIRFCFLSSFLLVIELVFPFENNTHVKFISTAFVSIYIITDDIFISIWCLYQFEFLSQFPKVKRIQKIYVCNTWCDVIIALHKSFKHIISDHTRTRIAFDICIILSST